MIQEKVLINAPYHLELRRISSSVSAFSVAIVLIWLQGGLTIPSEGPPWPILFFLVATPLCTASSLLSFVVSHREFVSKATDKRLDWFMTVGVGLGVGGFLSLLAERGGVISGVFVGAIIVSVFVFWIIARSIEPEEIESE